ncbi:hypothetical protein K3165_13910 [Qipengyuania sp. 1XM1-15A]|uniref:hypothetical protein n=1 Tax=Qipengyuania xiamenensis TaxID=2867237 RepID=UPI001C88DD85|nr:hypothetical protein [Qipengyuania xiamenensis]MBX7534026.1 hypothetical protein [Qipengyuania xiamenensis]
MFDGFFLIGFLGGPLALAYLLEGEAKRASSTLRPRLRSILLAPFAAWGAFTWILMAIVVLADGVNEQAFFWAQIASAFLTVVILSLSYAATVRRRRARLKAHLAN